MPQNYNAVSSVAPSILATNKVIKNTYILLSMTVLFSAFTAFLSMYFQLVMPLWAVIIGYVGLLFLTSATANSAFGLVSVFLFTGFMGLTLGPILNFYIHGFSNGPELVSASLASTGAIFFALSGYAMTTRKDFSYMGGFLFVGLMVAIVASIAGLFFNVPALQLAVSAAIVLLMGGYILFQTSMIIHGGERNYIMATINLYVSLFNLFVNLLNIFGALAGRRD
ncbi:MAG TPA: Bax inhibitor-1/YccA family protein [Gammaproteobacteria bacterium]|nr:Bax inhibitor-1/YccA family protein [Gammaproteobacteria bacterium]